MMKFYAEIVCSQKPLTIFASAIIDARQGTKFASDQVLLKPVIFTSITKEYNMVTWQYYKSHQLCAHYTLDNTSFYQMTILYQYLFIYLHFIYSWQ